MKSKSLYLPLLLALCCPGISHAQWVQVNSSIIAGSAFVASDTSLFVGTNIGVFRSTNNGSSWDSVNTGLVVKDIRSLAVSGTNLFAGTRSDPLGGVRGGIYRSTDNGTTWTNIKPPELSYTYIPAIAASGTELFIGTIFGVYRSTDTGTTWDLITVDSAHSGTYSAFAFAIDGTNVLAGIGIRAFRSYDTGTTWSRSDSGLPGTVVTAFAANGTNVFAGTDTGGVFLSTNGGAKWTAVNSGLTDHAVRALALNGTNLFAGGGGVFLSTDNGTGWMSVTSGLTDIVVALVVRGDNLFAATNGGVWRRPLSDMLPVQLASFAAQKHGPNAVQVTWTTVSEINNYGFYVQISSNNKDWANVGELIHGHGTTLEPQKYSVTLPIADVSKWVRLVQMDLDGRSTAYDAQMIQMDSPMQFKLEQNYPNPFNPSTTIRYGLTVRSHVTLSIYNTLGQLVATLANGSQDAGYHDVRFDGTGLASGVYFYRLQAESSVQTKKLTVSR